MLQTAPDWPDHGSDGIGSLVPNYAQTGIAAPTLLLLHRLVQAVPDGLIAF